MEGWSDCLREDLSRFGINVIIFEPGFMKTPLVMHEAFRTVSKSIESVSKETLNEYGGEQFKNKILESLKTIEPDDPVVVVNAYVNACMSQFPKSRYVVGKGSWVLLSLSYLPLWLRDRIRKTLI
eukprot:TRINITY_DN5340_c0_g1_i1.p1 TRINITY_DN5340_c0_g1~~TRINITY_DN5340_c0_g1_i1.p1  ORF type:complete len:146 (-),score=19.27 TRINITY_DN5340_c0_g1_i1:93-467(-)